MPPNQLAQVVSCTSGVLLMISAWDVGILKIIDVERIVTRRVEELAADPAANPPGAAGSAGTRDTARGTRSAANDVRRWSRGAPRRE